MQDLLLLGSTANKSVNSLLFVKRQVYYKILLQAYQAKLEQSKANTREDLNVDGALLTNPEASCKMFVHCLPRF